LITGSLGGRMCFRSQRRRGGEERPDKFGRMIDMHLLDVANGVGCWKRERGSKGQPRDVVEGGGTLPSADW